MGHSPTIQSFPEGADTAVGGNLFFYPTEHFHLGVGAYDGSFQARSSSGRDKPPTWVGPIRDAFLIGEADLTCPRRTGATDGWASVCGITPAVLIDSTVAWIAADRALRRIRPDALAQKSGR